MKKLLLVLFVAVALISSCRPKMYFLGGPTPLCLTPAKDAKGYYLYDPVAQKNVTGFVFDTVYVGYRQLICPCSQLGETLFYNHYGKYLFSASRNFYIFETPTTSFYLYENDRGYRWRSSWGTDQHYVLKKGIKTLWEASTPMEGYPYSRRISDDYYPTKL